MTSKKNNNNQLNCSSHKKKRWDGKGAHNYLLDFKFAFYRLQAAVGS